MNYTIVTVASKAPFEMYYVFDQFFESLRRYGKGPLVLGTEPNAYKGLGSKPKLLRKAILNGDIKTKYTIFCDSWDLLYAGNPDYIMELFKVFDSPFVCSAEKNCFPGDLKDKFPDHKSPYKYLNSGFIVAETDALLKVLESMDLDNVPDDYFDHERNCWHHTNDQFLFQQEFVKQPVKMVLDYMQILSQTLHDVKPHELDFNDRRGIRNIELDTYPMTFHMNGSAKSEYGIREMLLKRLGL
jgi:hypothetical protein